jgi:4-carboxymuconolactone decarboxylase
MHGLVTAIVALLWTALVAAQGPLPSDVHPESLNRLPGSGEGAAAIRRHESGVTVRWASPLGRQLTELAILTTARAQDQPYEWSLHELEALAVGLDPSIIDVVRHGKAPAGLGERDAVIIQIGREIFGTHKLRPETYARGLKLLGESNLVDIADLMSNYTATSARLTSFNQQMPSGWRQFLPLPFALPEDIHADSRSRLPLIRATPQNAPAPVPDLYSRNIAPEGTGPGQIRRHEGSLKSLETSAGRRLMALAILVTAREHDAQYEWTVNEPAAIRDGLEPSTIDIVRLHKPVTGLAEKEAALVQFGRELFGKHVVSPETYARALKAFGERDLVDFVGLMGQHAGDTVMLAAFDQHLTAGQKPLLPIP